MNLTRLVCTLREFQSPHVFNPYTEVCPQADLLEAPTVRLENLCAVVDACIQKKVDTIWVARDLGYRGGRRTGLALTDEANLSAMGEMLGVSLQKATKGPIVAERTAATIWETVRRLEQPVFLWNVFPFHPHEPELPFTNRCHTRAERRRCEPILSELLRLLRPNKIIAIGNDARAGLADLGATSSSVRHPSYGGKPEFLAGLSQLYGGLRLQAQAHLPI